MNLGGFSIWRLIGVSVFKSRISRAIGIPLTTPETGSVHLDAVRILAVVRDRQSNEPVSGMLVRLIESLTAAQMEVSSRQRTEGTSRV
jgi:hypothetical protein